jgi:catechol 2,3-dioxygenase-like lactoylglutathione lyase family enzyme
MYGPLGRIEAKLSPLRFSNKILTGERHHYLLRPMPRKHRVLGHIVLNVRDLKKSENFYRAILGLKVSARNLETKMTFLSFGREHHDVALQALPDGAKQEGGNGVPKLHHFCIYCERNDEIDKLYRVLKRHGIPIVSGPETLVVAGNRSISFLDPDGNRLELACNSSKFQHDERAKGEKISRSTGRLRKSLRPRK